MKIVLLDAHTLNPGDLSWEPLRQFGELTVYERTAPSELMSRVKNAKILLTNKVVLDKQTLKQLPHLQFIGVTATGYNVVDAQAARALGIPVANVAGYGVLAVAQHVMALLLELTNRVGEHHQSVAEGEWTNAPDWCYWKQPIIELAGLRMGIVGMGQIGQQVAKLADAFGMEVVYHAPRPKLVPYDQVSLDELFSTADVISFHCPLTSKTESLLSAKRLQQMKKSAYLINTGRGSLVDESALATALSTQQIAGAAVDVLSTEPPEADNPLLTAPNCLITPHQAWASKASRQRLLTILVENIRSFLAGSSQNIVN